MHVDGQHPDSLDDWQVTDCEGPEKWEQGLKMYRLPELLMGHLLTMGALHRAGRYDRQADGVQRLTGRPAMSVREFVSLHAEEFGGRRS
jgi:NAD(P)H dehydrogenase (quinone)